MTFRAAVGRFVLGPCLAGACLAWWLVGDLSEAGGDDQLVDLDALDRHGLTIGVIGVLVALCTLVAYARCSREERAAALSVVVGSAALGVAVGFALRVVSLRAVGANIGGGFLLYAVPLAVPLAIWLLLRKTWMLTERGQARS